MERIEIFDCGCGFTCLVANCRTRDAGGCYCCCRDEGRKYWEELLNQKEKNGATVIKEGDGYIYFPPPKLETDETNKETHDN